MNVALIILALAALIILMKMGKSPSGDLWTVYGTMGCGWTRKQLDDMKAKGINHKFVNCDNGGCDGIDAFPTLVDSKGEKHVGFKSL